MKTVVFLLSVITLVGSVAAQSSMQPPPLFKKRTQTSSTRRNSVRNPHRANPVRDNRSSLYGDSVDTPASKLTTQLDDAIRLQSSDPSTAKGKSRSIYDLDRSKVRLAGGEDDELRVAPAQFMPNQDFSNRPADGFLSARDSDRKDPATGNGLKLSPIPTPTSRPNNSLYVNQGPKPPLDFGKPASDPADTRKPGPSFFPATGNTSGDSLYGNNATGRNRNDLASVFQAGHQNNAAGTDSEPYLPSIPDTARSQPNENFIPAAGSSVAGKSEPKSMFDDDSFNFNQNDQGAGYAANANANTNTSTTGQQNGTRQPAPRARSGQLTGYGYGDSPTQSQVQTQNQAQSQEQRRQARRSNPNFSQPEMYGNQQQSVQNQTAQSSPAPVHRAGQQPVVQQQVQQPMQQQIQQPIQPAPRNDVLSQPQYAGSAYPATTYPPAATTTPTVVGTQPTAQQITAPVITPSTNYPNQVAPPDLRGYGTQIAQAGTPNFKPVTGGSPAGVNDIVPGTNNVASGNRPNTSGSYDNRNYEQGGVGIMTLLALFASIGLNVYLGWIAYDTYNRYQDLVADMRRTPARRSDRRERRTERRVTEAAY